MNSPVAQTQTPTPTTTPARATPRMKWFMALNQASDHYAHYSNFVKVAIHSAQQHSDLDPYVLFDGIDDHLTSWLRARGVTVILMRTPYYRQLVFWTKVYKQPEILSTAPGTFLRTEVPMLARRLGFDDPYLLYTDCDIMFRRAVSNDLAAVQPKLFAVAPEFQVDNYLHMNAGIMLFNVDNSLRVDWLFRLFIHLGMFRFVRLSRDQSAYRNFFSNRLRRTYRWDRLPQSFNWKPYWPTNPDAHIIHFHGPKPWQRAIMDDPGYPNGLRKLAREEFWTLCEEWDGLLAEAD